jgi:hypothetical protein
MTEERMEPKCYLCGGKPIPKGEMSKDHVVQHQLILRDQSGIAQGYDYGGFLPAHKDCNNKFGGRSARTEDSWRTALRLGNVLHDENCFKQFQRVDQRDVILFVLKDECLSTFSKDDLEFFGITEVLGKDYGDWSSPSFWKDKKRIDPYEKPRNIILSVLAKSAAAILVKRCGIAPEASWRILATLVVGENVSVLMDEFFIPSKPFDVDLNIKATQTETGDWFVCYVVGKLAAWFSFAVSQDNTWFNMIGPEFKDWGCYLFESDRLLNLISYDWKENTYS